MTTLEESIIQQDRKIPLLLKVISTIIMLEGILGFLFFSIILIYQLFNPDFISNWDYGHYSGSFLNVILIIYAIVHFGLVISAYYLLKLDKKGIYIVLLSITILLAASYLLHNQINWLGLMTGIFVLILLSYYVKSFK